MCYRKKPGRKVLYLDSRCHFESSSYSIPIVRKIKVSAASASEIGFARGIKLMVPATAAHLFEIISGEMQEVMNQ